MTLVGSNFPAFSLLDDQGQTVTEKAFQGHWTVLFAYPKDSTPGCTTEACDFRDNFARLQSLGAQVFGISRDAQKSHQNFIAKQSLPFRLLSDPNLELLQPLGAFGPKIMYGKQVEGIIRSTFLIDPKGVLRQTWPKVRVKGHVDAVVTALQALTGKPQ